MAGDIKKVVLAYSGGLDTSIILRWLQETYNCEVVTFTADLGQGDEQEVKARIAKIPERLEQVWQESAECGDEGSCHE